MFDTARKASSRFGRPAKLVLSAVAAFTLLTGGAALADESTSTGTQDSQATAAESLLHADNPLITRTETADAKDAAEAAADAADAAAEAVNPVEPADGAQGAHGACVSKVAQSTSLVGRAHGKAVSAAAHTCLNGSGDVAGQAKGAEKSAAAKAKRDAKAAARTAKGKS
jgi:predicted nucleic acid-binding protein